VPAFNSFNQASSNASAPSTYPFTDYNYSSAPSFQFNAPFNGSSFYSPQYPIPQNGFAYAPPTFFPPSPFANVNLGALTLLPGLFGQPGLGQMTPAQLYQLLSQFQTVLKNQGLYVGDLANFEPTAQQASAPSSESPSTSPATERKRKHTTAPSAQAPSTSTAVAPVAPSSPDASNSSRVASTNGNSANGVPRRIRLTRPKVVESKGAVQCRGRNRKKGVQCRNAALMEYIGPRPIYCAEHIELDPKSLYEKCKSSYQKEVGDNKGCKEVVLKEFGYCYKHYNDLVADIIRTNDVEKAIAHHTRICQLVVQLEKDATAAKKKDGDLYQRKNKLIPKFQEMKKAIAKTMQTFGQEVAVPQVSASETSPASSFTSSDSESDLNCHQDASDELPEEISPQISSLHEELLNSHGESSLDDDISSDDFNDFHPGHSCDEHAIVEGHSLSDSGSSSEEGDAHYLYSSNEVNLDADFVNAVDGHGITLMGAF